ncbi:MAG TPA: YncE family protein [Bacteroidia bacterium]|nr:YncE family protein [Bacteroidia bacterium]
MKTIKLSAAMLLLAMAYVITGCKKDKEQIAPPPHDFSSGLNDIIFIINEGNFGSGDGSVTFFRKSTHEVVQDIFKLINSRPLGDVVQSMTLSGDNGYIVVNNSHTVEVVNKNNFLSLGTINGFAGPRFLLPISSSKAYVSDWFDNNIKVVDLNSLAITGNIPTGNGPEQMALINNKVFVVNIGGYGIDSTVTVIDANMNTVITTIQTSLNPNSVVIDANGKIWVLCNGWYGGDFQGGTSDDVAGALIEINPETYSIEKTLMMGQFDHPFRLTINKDKNVLYYLMGVSGFDGSIYKFHINSSALPSTPLVVKNFYGLGIDPANQDLYGAYSPVFGQSGYMFRYANNGTFKDSTKVGIGPNGFVFNY